MRVMARLRSAVRCAAVAIPIATGKSEATRFAFRDLAELPDAKIFQPDLAICGGISEAMRIAALAIACQIRLAPHLWGVALIFAADRPPRPAVPTARIIEDSLGANLLLFDLSEEAPVRIDGMAAIDGRPGLGVTVSDDFVKEFAVARRRRPVRARRQKRSRGEPPDRPADRPVGDSDGGCYQKS